MTFSALSFTPKSTVPTGAVPLIGEVRIRLPSRFRKSSGEAEAILIPGASKYEAHGAGCLLES